MNHPYYEQPNSFTPSKSTLNTWLKTRKSNSPSKPGIFETVDYTRDTTWAIISILIEASALFLTLYGAIDEYQDKGKISLLITASILVALFIAFDIIGILLHSYDNPTYVKTKNEIKITTDQIKLKQLYDKLNNITWRTFLGFILLILSASMKILAVTYYFKNNAAALGIIVLCILYLIIIYIHLYHTSFWLSGISTKKKIKKEYNKYRDNIQRGINNPFSVNPNQHIFFTPFNMGQDHFQNGRQSITFNNVTTSNGVQLNQYTLSSEGCLWDDDITSLTMFFNHNFNEDLIKACIHLQFIQLGELL
tara:strand:+ start:12 stop:932 length:921 start_codon:yes stop_codon:yes gene_type:complete